MKRALGWGCALAPVALLAMIVSSNVNRRIVCPSSSWVKSDLIGIEGALDGFADSNGGRYPSSLADLIEPDAEGERFLDQPAVPIDPWGNEFGYEPAPDRRSFDLFTFGEDGVLGGDGEAADIHLAEIRRPHRAVPRAAGAPVEVPFEPFVAPAADHAAPLRVDQPPPSEQPE